MTNLNLTEAELMSVMLALFDAREKGSAEDRINTRLALRKVYEAQDALDAARREPKPYSWDLED
jgi:hypothetical protein